MQVPEVVGGAGLQGRRPSPGRSLQLEAPAPPQVLRRVGVVRQDIGHQVGGLRRELTLGLGRIGGVVVDDVAGPVGDLVDHVRRREDPAVGQCAIRAGQVEHVHPDGAQRERGDGHVVGLLWVPLEAKALRHVDHLTGPDELL